MNATIAEATCEAGVDAAAILKAVASVEATLLGFGLAAVAVVLVEATLAAAWLAPLVRVVSAGAALSDVAAGAFTTGPEAGADTACCGKETATEVPETPKPAAGAVEARAFAAVALIGDGLSLAGVAVPGVTALCAVATAEADRSIATGATGPWDLSRSTAVGDGRSATVTKRRSVACVTGVSDCAPGDWVWGDGIVPVKLLFDVSAGTSLLGCVGPGSDAVADGAFACTSNVDASGKVELACDRLPCDRLPCDKLLGTDKGGVAVTCAAEGKVSDGPGDKAGTVLDKLAAYSDPATASVGEASCPSPAVTAAVPSIDGSSAITGATTLDIGKAVAEAKTGACAIWLVRAAGRATDVTDCDVTDCDVTDCGVTDCGVTDCGVTDCGVATMRPGSIDAAPPFDNKSGVSSA